MNGTRVETRSARMFLRSSVWLSRSWLACEPPVPLVLISPGTTYGLPYLQLQPDTRHTAAPSLQSPSRGQIDTIVFSSWLLQSPTGATVRHSTQCCAPESAILRGQSPTRPQRHREERIAKRQGNRLRVLLSRYLILTVPICRQYSPTRTKRRSSGRCPKPPTRSRLSL
jgi:hypothetical protein